MSFIKQYKEVSKIEVYVQPGASKNEIVGIHNGKLKIKIKAPPRDGEANEGLIEFLAEFLKISKKGIFLIQGESSRNKVLVIELSPEVLLAKF